VIALDREKRFGDFALFPSAYWTSAGHTSLNNDSIELPHRPKYPLSESRSKAERRHFIRSACPNRPSIGERFRFNDQVLAQKQPIPRLAFSRSRT
jgi:hypothetical protein